MTRTKLTTFCLGSESEQQFRFDVALRRRDDSGPVSLFATYRGSVNCPSPTQKIVLTLECSNGDGKKVWTCPVLDGVEYIKVGKGDLDSRSMFPASEQGSGLMFLSPYGIRPVANQDLRYLQSEIHGFVVDGKTKASTAVSKGDAKCNTITRQNPFGFTEHYLFIDKSMEKGQCVEVCFRKLSSLLQSAPFRNTLFQFRHLLVESLGLLSRSDLRQLLSFLEELSKKIDFRGALAQIVGESNFETLSRFKEACRSRRRLHWIATKVAIILHDWRLVPPHQPDAIVSVNASLYFGALLSQSEDAKFIPAELATELRESIREEVKQELLTAVDLDQFCGSRARKSWCSLFTLTFERFLDCILENHLDDESPNAAIVLEKLCSCLSSCVSVPLLQTLGDVALSETPGDHVASQVFPEEDDINRPGIEPHASHGVREFFACEPPEEVETEGAAAGASVVFCPRRDALIEGTMRLSQRWYRERQWWIVMTLIAKAGMLLSYEERLTFMHPRALYELKSRFLRETELPTVEDPTMEIAGPMKVLSSECPAHEPPSFPFFLGLVWPKLRAFGWRLEAGETPPTVTFIAPDIKVIPSKRSNPWKQRRDVLRTKLARATNQTGLGNLTKVTKRVVISVIPHPEGDAAASEPDESKGVSTAEALQRFLLHVQDDLEDDTTRELAARVVNLVRTCFDELAPNMTSVVDVEGEAEPPPESQTAGAPSDRLSCDYLLRFLLVLPSILRQSELPLQEINDCTEVVSQLASWMTLKHASLFHKKFHPSKESYAPPKQPKQTPPDLSRRLKTLHSVTAAAAANGNGESGGAGSALVMKELIRPEDKYGLTEFLVKVLDQAVPCRATEHDIAKKFRRVNVGYPGFVCRHCMGRSGEGRYFFSSIESLTTASTVFEKHVGKCKHVPDEVKAAVVDAKTRHVEQRKQLPVGSQQAYFNKLWDRLRSCQIEGSASGTYVLEGTAKKSSTDSLHESTEEQEFRDHRDVLDFVNARSPWKDHPVIVEALVKYYGFVEYGGRIHNASSMPVHFSAEWLLRKVGPKPKISRKKKLMPG
jgi:MRG